MLVLADKDPRAGVLVNVAATVETASLDQRTAHNFTD
jgi:hypothetical protein